MVRKPIQIILIFLLFTFLIACGTQTEQKEEQPQTIPEKIIIPENTSINAPEILDPIVKSVKQTGTITATYGLTKDDRIRTIEKNGEKWEYIYQRGKLSEIKGPTNIEFFYNQGKLHQIKTQGTTLLFNYDQAERPSHITGGKETIYLGYDTQNNIRTVNRGVAGETAISYDKNGNVKEIERARRITKLYYDDRDRVRQFDGDETQLILGYFKDDKLISMSGNTFGQGLTISYGPGTPPLEAKIIHGQETTTITSSETNSQYTITDDYIYCNFARRLPEIIFEGNSFAIFKNYYNGTITDYLVKHYTCVPYET